MSMGTMEELRAKLNKLILVDSSLYQGEILKTSQELDKYITEYYLLQKKCS